MRRLLVLLSLAGVLLIPPAVGEAATIRGTNGPDRLSGTLRADLIFGRNGDDHLSGRTGDDLLDGGAGSDTVAAQGGADRVVAQADGSADSVSCGTGRDIVNADAGDRVAADCEIVSRQLSHDPYTDVDAQHATQVEPASFSHGSTIVTAFQSGRDFGGGASNIGFATSSDGGHRWRAGFLPALTVLSTPGGLADRVSDPVVGYDERHGVWLITSLAIATGFTQLLVSRSADGIAWSLPVVAARASSPAVVYDKEWIACDNWGGSPFRGRCYLAYTDEVERQLRLLISSDGGSTWTAGGSPPVEPDEAHDVIGALPLPRPDGSLVVAYVSEPETIVAARSNDGGETLAVPARVASIRAQDVPGVRSEPLPSLAVDRVGTLYAAWHDCRFRSGCPANDVVLSRSRDGIAWTAPTRVSRQGGARSTAFIPALAADAAAAPGGTHLAITYYVLDVQACRFVTCATIGARRVTSADGGRTWGRPDSLVAQPMRLTWLPDTTAGRMLGDYMGTSFTGGHAVSVFALASQPVDGRFRQAIFATAPR